MLAKCLHRQSSTDSTLHRFHARKMFASAVVHRQLGSPLSRDGRVAAWLCRTLLDVDECRSKRPADTASDVAISTSKVKSSRRNVQRFDRFDSLRRIRISGKSTSASRNIIRTKLHVFLFFFGMAVFLCEVYSEKCDFPLTRGFAASGAKERHEKRIREAKKTVAENSIFVV